MLLQSTPVNTSLTPKISSIHIENYYELWYTSNNFFQYDIYTQHFDKILINKIINNKSISLLNESWDDVHDEWFILDKHSYLSHLTFYEFFIENQIDIPSCFKKSYSLLRPQRELTILKFITYFMRHGLKLKTQNSFILSLNNFFKNNFTQNNPTLSLSWQFVFLTLQNSFYTTNKIYSSTSKYTNSTLTYNHYLSSSSKNISSELNIYSLLYKNIIQLFPIFSFYIYKVDKKIFKNTRGKSGKFTFIWKFVAPYKRLSWVMYWLAKEIKLKTGKTIHSRFQNLFYDILFSPQSTWVYKVKRFSYNYVYRNSRSTLAETYRTVTK